jgi:cell division protein FtsB
MRILLAGLMLLLGVLQYQLWFGSGSLAEVRRLHREADLQREENARLRERNRVLDAEVSDLKQGLEAIEEQARLGLGMIKEGEVFYQIVEPPPQP